MNIPKYGDAIPEELGAVVDLYKATRDLRLAMDKKVAEVKARENELQEHLINNLDKGATTGVAGRKYRAQVISKRKYRLLPEGWQAFTKWIAKNKRFDMLQHRLSDKAVGELYENENKLPDGVETLTVPSLSVRKI